MTKSIVGTLLGAALCLAAANACAGDLIVVEARGIGLKPGQKIDDSQKLTLADGQRVTLIAATGRTLKLSGPYDAVPGAEAAGGGSDDLNKAVAALAALRVQKEARLNEVGLVRAGTEVQLPEPWVLDGTHDGNLCLRQGQPPVFWRQGTSQTAALVLEPADRSWSIRADWPSGSDRIAVPTNYPIRDKSNYIVDINKAQRAVTFNIIPASVGTPPVQAAWMLEKGCVAQAEALLKTIQ
jgi:hypothetical protein